MSEDGGHERREPRGQALLQRGADEVLRAEAEEDLRQIHAVGEMRAAALRETGGAEGQHTLLKNVGAPSVFTM